MPTVSLAAPRGRSIFFGTAAIAFFLYSILVLLALHVLRPEYSPASHYISEYAVGRFGWLMTTWFLAIGIGCLMLALGLKSVGLASRLGQAGILVLAILSFASLIAAGFPMDPPGGPPTLVGRIHALNFLVSISSVLFTQILLTLGFGIDPRWRSYQRLSIVLTALLLLAYAAQFYTASNGVYEGVANRFYGVVWLAWLLATSLRVRRLACLEGSSHE